MRSLKTLTCMPTWTEQSGKRIRLSRIFRPESGRSVTIAFAYGMARGSVPEGNLGSVDLIGRFEAIVEAGADAIVLSPGLLRIVSPVFGRHTSPAIILAMDWTNMWRPADALGYKEGTTAVTATVEDALRLGADAVMTYLFLGLQTAELEAEQVAKNASISRECERLGLVHIIESMARGSNVPPHSETRTEYLRLHTRMAAELGADIVKTDWNDDADEFAKVVAGCPVPILIAGGSKRATPTDALRMAEGAIRSGARGVVFGRNVTQATHSAKMVRALVRVVHEDAPLADAENELN